MKATPFWKTYAVLGVLAGLGAYVWFVERKREDKPDKPKEKVFALDKSKARALTIDPAEGQEIRVVKEGGAWRLAAPFAAPADHSEVDSLLTSLEGLEIDEVVVETPGDLADFGLAEPRISVAVLQEGGPEPRKLLLGAKTPDGNSVYARTPDRPRVFTLPGYLEGSFDKKPFDLRDRDLLHVKRDSVKALSVSGPEGAYTLARDDKGEWSFTAPLATRAGRWSVDGLLGSVENLRMESVAAEEAKDPKELKRFGLDKPARTVTLALAEGGSKTLELGGSAGDKKFYAREAGRPLVAVVPGALVDDLAKGMGELRAKRLLDVATYEVVGFDVEADGAKRSLTRSTVKDKDGVETQKWKKGATDVETNKVQDALFLIGGIEVKEFVDKPSAPPAYGLDRPAFKLTLRYEGAGKAPVWFELGKKDADYYARREADQSVLKLDPAKAEELIKAFKAL